MKKFYSLMIIVLSLFSCVLFSACGDKYEKLKMNIYSSKGELIEGVQFIIDENNVNAAYNLGIEFLNIDEEDIGQVVVYSQPEELITVTNYSYSANKCYIDLVPNMSSNNDAKLIVSHLASGKKKQIPLIIKQKSNSLNVVHENYLVSIPKENENVHVLDLKQAVEMLPSGSSDELYFKVIDNNNQVVDIESSFWENYPEITPIPLENVEGLTDVFIGFKVSSEAEETNMNNRLKICPITYLEGYDYKNLEMDQNRYLGENKFVYVNFKKLLDSNDIAMQSDSFDNLNEIELISNDAKLYTCLINLNYITNHSATPPTIKMLYDTEFYNYYRVEAVPSDELHVMAFTNSQNDIILSTQGRTDDFVDVAITFQPINYVGDIYPIVLNVKVKAHMKADKILTKKNGQEVLSGEKIDIFDYYKDESSLGTLFEFEPITHIGEMVNENLSSMEIVVSPSILTAVNLQAGVTAPTNLNSTKYSLLISKEDGSALKFTSESVDELVSEPLSKNDKIYIKYVKGGGDIEPSDFSLIVKTRNNSSITYWDTLIPTTNTLDFNRMKGVVSMDVLAGYYILGTPNSSEDKEIIDCVYLDKDKGLDKVTTQTIYIKLKNLKGLNGSPIVDVQFDVKVKSLDGEKENPLLLYDGKISAENLNTQGINSFKYIFTGLDPNAVGLVFNSNTDIGRYEITFAQEGNIKGSVICVVYQTINSLDVDKVSFETNNKAFENTNYKDPAKDDYINADYIVASGQGLDISIDIPQNVFKSGLLLGYNFDFEIGTSADNGINVTPFESDATKYETEKKKYFDKIHDGSSFNTAQLNFKQGTFINTKQYVYVKISVELKDYSDIVTPKAEPAKLSVYKSFFIYDEIKKSNVSINETSKTMMPDKFTGVYYKDIYSSGTLSISIPDYLKNYVNEVVWTVDGTKIDDSFNANGVSVISYDLYSTTFKFDSISSQLYTRIIRVHIYQFENMFELQCVFTIEQPILTELVEIESDVYSTDSEVYINLKKDETYEVKARNISTLGAVTHDEIIIQVADKYGNALRAIDIFEVDQENSKIKVNKIGNEPMYKLIVFAKDVLVDKVNRDKSGYDEPSSFIMNFNGDDVYENRYSNAYFVINIYLSDGTEETPYLINNADDFWSMDDAEGYKTSYWQLKTNLSLDIVKHSSVMQTISGFKGYLSTDENKNLILDGIYLDNDMPNLFANFGGEIRNIKFVVNYSYSGIVDKSSNLGLFDINNGTLTNVSADIHGENVTLNGEKIYNFGGLVGENHGTISYTSGVGVDGNIKINGTAIVYFGGLVGKNVSLIEGCETTAIAGGENQIILNVSGGRQNSLSIIEIESTLTGESAIGGVVGLNTYHTEVGTITNAFVQATINAQSTNNVGGVIGKNSQEKSSLTVSNNNGNISVVFNDDVKSAIMNNAICNVKSASTIIANENAGGIVGYDENGVYYECDYQILSSNYKEFAIDANQKVGGIVGSSNSGKFVFCSVMSYNWNYNSLKTDVSKVINDVADINATDYVGGIVGFAISDSSTILSGDQDVSNKVFVLYSSVNAYLKSTNNIGGLISSEPNNRSILYNAYFIGKLEGNVVYDDYNLCLDSCKNVSGDYYSYYNTVYSLNLKTENGATALISGSYHNGANFTINTEDNPKDFWWWNTNINGGYIFITTEKSADNSSLPIFDLAPDSIEVKVRNPKIASSPRTLVLEYYDFSIAENISNETLVKLINQYNRSKYIYRLEEIGGSLQNIGELDITATPSGLGQVVVNVRSTNPSIVDITYDGKLLINNIGECELIFSSLLNPNAGDPTLRTIKVVVDYPIGDNFVISNRLGDINGNIGSSQNIEKGKTKQYYAITSGVIQDDVYINKKYPYITKSNLNLEVKVEYVGNINIHDYVLISGNTAVKSTYDEVTGKSTLIVNLDDKTPFMISVIKQLEIGSFDVTVTPYTMVQEYSSKAKTFRLSTMEGVTNCVFSYDEAIVYPNDEVYVNAYLTTDNKITSKYDVFVNMRMETTQSQFEYVLVGTLSINTEFVTYEIEKAGISVGSFTIYIIDEMDEYENNVQKIKFRIEFSDIEIDQELNLNIKYLLPNLDYGMVNYTILPQRINKIEIKNYFVNNSNELEMVNILKPNHTGEIKIDIVPNNGYYDYLEISDITGDQEIVFIQIDENGNALTLQSDPSHDGKGIKLYAEEGKDPSMVRVLTQISNNYDSKMHTVEVRAYSSNGTMIASQKVLIDVKMLPEIKATYVLPDGSDSSAIASNVGNYPPQVKNQYLANGVSANFRVETKYANTQVKYTIFATNQSDNYDAELVSKYELVNIVDNHYILRRKDKTIDSADIGKKVKITFTVSSELPNGDEDIAECSMEFEIVSFVIHGVSVNSSINNANTKEIYGYFDREIELNFYFDENDISYFDITSTGEYFWDTEYVYNENYVDNGSHLDEIQAILKKLNTQDTDHPYLILNDNTKKTDTNEKHLYNDATISNITLEKNKLTVQNKDFNPKYLAVAFRMYYLSSNSKWFVEPYTNSTTAQESYIVDKNYNLNFIEATKWYEPTVIDSAEKFKTMTSGGRYILNKDLTGSEALTNYTPIDADIVEFDGNGHTIEINSFALFNENALNAGLFKQIYPNMIVKNVKVIYNSIQTETKEWTFGCVNNGVIYTDVCNNPNVAYTSVNFGGLAAINNGLITNCVVEGTIAIRASNLEKGLTSTSNLIDFNIAGMVAKNLSTGYITNCVSELQVYSQANIGGFVHTNAGKIVSCGVEENTTIYAYNSNLGNTIEVQVGGFVVNNSNRISMSYVNLKKKTENYVTINGTKIYQGTMSVKDYSAGFAYSNAGEIDDAYVQISEIGINNNRFAGFVNSNSGTIARAYSYVNNGKEAISDNELFIISNSGRLINCIEFNQNTYVSEISGLNVVKVDYKQLKSVYEEQKFAFGDNVSAVWTFSYNTLPELVSTKELLFDDFNKLTIEVVGSQVENGVESITYETKFGKYGTKQNPYIIHNLATWNDYLNPQKNLYMTSYYRIVKDIDFASVGDNPTTSNLTFSGNIQGNNMSLSNIMLYSAEQLSSIGLFKKLEGVNDKSVVNAVRNLKLSSSSIWASSTSMVGVLAGEIKDFNIYNITIDAENVVMVGKNAVGGLAGIINGEFDLDQISSNIGASSTRASTLNNYSIYMSKNNRKNEKYNLNNVYYSGSIAGIIDGYDNASINDNRDISRNYYKVRNIIVSGQVNLSGDSVGAAFGLVGERVYVDGLKVNVSGSIFGYQYSAGAIGENRGVLENANITLSNNIFARSQNVSAGAVGFNMGGLVRNIEVQAEIMKTSYGQTVGGIVGRNIYGTISNSHFDGKLFGYYTGGIIGANYSKDNLLSATSGGGVVSMECKANDYLIPSSTIEYKQGVDTIKNLENLSLSKSTFDYFINNLNMFYSYKNDEGNANEKLSGITIESRVLGLIIGLGYNADNVVNKIRMDVYDEGVSTSTVNYNIIVIDEKVVFNSEITNVKYNLEEKVIELYNSSKLIRTVNLKDEDCFLTTYFETYDNVVLGKNEMVTVEFDFENIDLLSLGISTGRYYVLYLVGAESSSFDSWSVYSNEYILVG